MLSSIDEHRNNQRNHYRPDARSCSRSHVGTYEVSVSSPGFSVFRETGIYVEPAGTYTVNAVITSAKNPREGQVALKLKF